MYLRQQDYALTAQIMPIITSVDAYDEFVLDMSTMFVFNSWRYMIWQNKTQIELPTIWATSVHHSHKDQATDKKMFGYPIKFKEAQAHQLHFNKLEHEQEM